MGYGLPKEDNWKEGYGVPFIMYSSVRVTQSVCIGLFIEQPFIEYLQDSTPGNAGAAGEFKVKDGICNPEAPVK